MEQSLLVNSSSQIAFWYSRDSAVIQAGAQISKYVTVERVTGIEPA